MRESAEGKSPEFYTDGALMLQSKQLTPIANNTICKLGYKVNRKRPKEYMEKVLLHLLNKNIIYGHYEKPLTHQEGKNQNDAEILCYPDEHSYRRENESQTKNASKDTGKRTLCLHTLSDALENHTLRT